MTPRLSSNPPFLGRATELAQLTGLLDETVAGRPQIAVLRGAAGIGKTRLAEEAALVARSAGFRVASGRGWPDGDAPPFWPWRAVLADLGADPRILDDSHTSQEPGRFARFVAVLEQLRAASRVSPLHILLDDAHLADPASLLLAGFVSRERQLPVSFLLACRDDDDAAASAGSVALLSDLMRHAVVIALGGLPNDIAGAYLEAFSDAETDPDLLRVMISITKGNPLHLRSVAFGSHRGAGGIARGLERAIGEQLDRLADGDRRLVGVAALLGADVSIHDVARITDSSPAAVGESFSRAANAGLIDPVEGGIRFVHDLVRRQAAGCLALTDRLAAHARAAESLVGPQPDRVARRAYHALVAAGRSTADAERAVAIARDAARALKNADGPESAAALLGRAVEVQAAALPDTPAAPLAVEHAEAVLSCGRLAESRPLFQHAARVAEHEGDATALARAALGLGGLWISEHRLESEAASMLALQHRALDALPTGDRVLRARLTARLTAEAAYRGGGISPVLDALEDARRTGDAYATAEALSLAHHALLMPAYTQRRLAMATELVSMAGAAGDGLLTLVGLCWRAVDLFHLGHPRAPAALEELTIRADALRCRCVSFIAHAMRVMLAIRAGAFERAEADAAACFALGSEVGDADAVAYHGAHLSAIRYFQGREAELADFAATISASPTLIGQRERAFAAAAAIFALRAGRPQPAQALLQQLARDGLGSIPASSSWLTTVFIVAELTQTLDATRVAKAAYDALLPYAHLPVMPSLAVVCFGSVHRSLGAAAATCGNLDLAIEHLSAAVSANEELRHRPAAIQARAELGLARLRRGSGDDRAHARGLLQEAIDEGEALGMTGLVARWRQATASLLPADRAEARFAVMAQVQGGKWRVAFDDQVATVRHRVGLHYLSQLVGAPDRGIPALALVLQGDPEPEDGTRDPLMDAKALAAVRERIGSLRNLSDPSLDESDELEALTRELARGTGLGGRLRSFADAPERARTAVRKAIKRAIDEIAAANPALGRHLVSRVETGTVCCYHSRAFAAGRP